MKIKELLDASKGEEHLFIMEKGIFMLKENWMGGIFIAGSHKMMPGFVNEKGDKI